MKKRSKYLYSTTTVAATAALFTSCDEAKPVKPNIIIIYADDVGIGDLNCYGTGAVPTPNVDRLASEGVRFSNSHTTSATSTPSRYGMLTGTYPWRVGGTGIAAGDAAMIIKPEQYTIADIAKSAGYTTGAVGKWHLGLGDKTGQQDWNGVITPGLESIGFDYSFIMAATGDRVPCVYIENGRAVNLDPNDPIEVSYTTPFAGEPTGKENPELLKLHPSNGHDMAIVNGVPRIGYMKGGKSALWRDEDIADRITEKAVSFIEENQKQPFMLYFGTNDIHVPRVPNERFVGKSGLGARGDAILQFDYSVGQILETLDRLGLTQNTIVILSSDNGPVIDDGYRDMAVELLGNHKPMGKYRGGKYSAFEAGTRVPMIVRWPGKSEAGKVSDALFSHIDMAGSLANAIGVEIVEGGAPDTGNALDVMIGKDVKGREYVIEQNLHNTLSVLCGDWKYISPSNEMTFDEPTATELGNNPQEQLYNVKDDAGEQINLAAKRPDKVAELKAILDKCISRKQVSTNTHN